jgi:hypothetical protein
MAKFVDVAGPTVFMGDNIPAHDETHDLAELIGSKLDEFRDYVESVRDADQADDAVVELLQAFLKVHAGRERVTETVAIYYAVSETGNRSIAASTFNEAQAFVDAEDVWERVDELQDTVTYIRREMDRKARTWVQEQYEGTSIGAWSVFDCWQFITEHYIGGRAKFLIDNA